jgi:hypothetical protein
MASDIDILRRASDREGDLRDKRPPNLRSWSAYHVGATRADINRLIAEELIVVTSNSSRIGPGEYSLTRYRLTEKGRSVIFSASMEREFRKVPRSEILEAMYLVVGFDDLKLEIAKAVEKRKKTNFLLEGPPACAKSVMLEAVRTVVPDAYMAFGSRTSAAGLSDILFEFQPGILLLDEADKMRHDVFSVLLGLMERGEILETKNQKTRGITLETMVIAACNSSTKMPREFLSRFALHAKFPPYERDEFIDVVRGFLTRASDCPAELSELIGQCVFDLNLGDIRRARAVWDLMDEPTEAEVRRVIRVMQKYDPENHTRERRKPAAARRLPGME